MARRTLDSFDNYRRALNGTGDIVIGAYARQQRRRRIWLLSFGLALIAGAVALIVVLQPHDAEQPAGSYPIVVKCVNEDCGYVGTALVEPGPVPVPLLCPQCGKRSCQKLWICHRCGQTFLLRAGVDRPCCPYCKSENIGAATEVPKPAQPLREDVQ